MLDNKKKFESLLEEKEELLRAQRNLLEAKEELTKYIDSNQGSDGSRAGTQDAIQCLRKACDYLTDGVTWTGQSAGNAKLTLDTLSKNLLNLAEYIRSTLDAYINELQQEYDNVLMVKIAQTAKEMNVIEQIAWEITK